MIQGRGSQGELSVTTRIKLSNFPPKSHLKVVRTEASEGFDYEVIVNV